MEYSDLIRKRYSVRAYLPTPVEDHKLQAVLEAARLAPTAVNLQPFQLIVVHTAGRSAELQRVYARAWLSQAPIVICACALPDMAWARRDGRRFADVDTTIAFDHLILAATDLGLGTCWIAAFDGAAARQVFGIPPEVEPMFLTPLGYAADVLPPKQRKPLSDLVRYEHW